MIIEALAMVLFHTVDGREVYVNPVYVISTTTPKDADLVTAKVHCVISFIDAKFISVRETCAEVNSLLYRGQP